MLLEIISPEKTLFGAEVESVSVPGSDGSFQMLSNHAPIVSTLSSGVIKIKGYYGKPNCRLIEHVYINQNNIAQNSYDTACRAESGQCAMIK